MQHRFYTGSVNIGYLEGVSLCGIEIFISVLHAIFTIHASWWSYKLFRGAHNMRSISLTYFCSAVMNVTGPSLLYIVP